jgi:hypothetical protein
VLLAFWGVSRQKVRMAARRFLYIIAGLIALVVVCAVAYKAFEPNLWRLAFIPGKSFDADTRAAAPDYTKPSAWLSHPDAPNPRALMTPEGYRFAPVPATDVFYVTPTTYLNKTHWNDPLTDAESRALQDVMLAHQANIFNAVGRIWSPRYRQATFGSFMKPSADSASAIKLAYSDVLAAFDAFQAVRDARRPFILAGHSQGSLHLLQLLKDRIAGRPAQKQMVATYLVGWPVSVEADLAPLGIEACQTPSATGCVISWQSFGPEADLSATARDYTIVPTLSGKSRSGTRQVCINPVTFWANTDTARKELNIGALPYVRDAQKLASLKPHLTGATCSAEGFLVLDPAPGDPFAERKMPNDNYHVYDYNLFWVNIRANAEIRVENFLMPT